MSEMRSSDPLVEAFGQLPQPSARELNIEAFIKSNVSRGRRIALVTSGGTAAPLEKTGVRFIDNFSTGKRGAAIAEVLLEQVNPSYAVIFLARKGWPTPWLRHVHDSLENDINGCLRIPENTRGKSQINLSPALFLRKTHSRRKRHAQSLPHRAFSIYYRRFESAPER